MMSIPQDRLSPDFKTIADFRRDNGPAIRRVCAQFITLCRQLKLFSEAVVAIDGKFKAVNNTDRNFSARKLQARREQLEHSVGRYLDELDRADREPTRVTEVRAAHIKHKIGSIKARMKELGALGEQIRNAPDGQVSLTDPDARCIATSGKGTAMVGYNVQTAVDTEESSQVSPLPPQTVNRGVDTARRLVTFVGLSQGLTRTQGAQAAPNGANQTQGATFGAGAKKKPSFGGGRDTRWASLKQTPAPPLNPTYAHSADSVWPGIRQR